MDRAVIVRRGLPVTVFALVLGGLVVAGRHHGSPRALRPIPVAAAGDTARNADAAPAMAPYGGKLVIPDTLVTGLPTHGPVYRVHDAAGLSNVRALAAALHVPGEPRQENGAWVAGPPERMLRVPASVAGAWSLGSGTDAGDIGSGGSGTATAEPGSVAPDTPVSKTNDVVAAPPPTPCPAPAPDEQVVCGNPGGGPVPSPPPLPTDAQARAAAQPVLDATGLAGATATLDPQWGVVIVNASSTVGGLPAKDFGAQVAVDVHGTITFAGGFLSSTAVEDDYPLLDPRAALERSPGSGIEPMILAPAAPCVSGALCPTAPPDRVVTKIRLGLSFMPSFEHGDAYLVPAWLLTIEGQTDEVSLLALPGQYLATPPPVPYATDVVATPDTAKGATPESGAP